MQVLQEQKPAQRGNNREVCFIETEYYQFYLQLRQELSLKFEVLVHAYCLIANSIHFLVMPVEEDSISIAMKRIGSRYAQDINKKCKRTGILWEGRYKFSLIQSKKYLLTCYRYIELNPVRAAIVNSLEEYNWSSHHFNAWGYESWLVHHAECLILGHTPEEHLEAYRELFRYHISNTDLHRLRQATHYSQSLGDDRFSEFILERYGIHCGKITLKT